MSFPLNSRGSIFALAITVALGAIALALIFGWAGPSISQQQPEHKKITQQEQAKAEAPQPAELDRERVLILIRTALLALDHANKTGNYTVLRDLGAPDFRATNSAARLSEIFADLRARNLDLSGVAILAPQLAQPPIKDPGGRLMRMAGSYSGAVPVDFDLLWQTNEAGGWLLFGIAVTPTPTKTGSQPSSSGAAPASKPEGPRLRGTAR
jgi:hypothetical protein